ncbi:MAG: uridine kinase [Chloroflexi bacterium]|nr:uridine kinase [Chloroflexota bacterium]
MVQRTQLLNHIAREICLLPKNKIVRVAVDGVDGAGKTTFADELSEAINPGDRPVIRASIDGFHNPESTRYRLGKRSPRGFFQDSYNYQDLFNVLLDPLGPEGNGWYRRAIFDHRSNSKMCSELEYAEMGSILIFDGIFLHRPELRPYWDYSVFLEVTFKISIPRTAQRGGGSPDPSSESNTRYVEGQKIYLTECQPIEYATIVINNENLAHPYIVIDS